MRIRIEVVDEDIRRTSDVLEELKWDILEKYPKAEADFREIEKGNVEFLVRK
jgi:hypothetical protein